MVEDDLNAREMLRAVYSLAKDGRLALDDNGREALDLLTTKNRNLVLLDLMMPEMDGFEFLDDSARRTLNLRQRRSLSLQRLT